MQVKEEKDKRMFDAQSQLNEMSDRITNLESVEMEMLSNLKNTVNEHNKLLAMAKSGNLDVNSIMQSQQKFNPSKEKHWK